MTLPAAPNVSYFNSVTRGTEAMFILGLRVFRPHVVRRSKCHVLAFRVRDAALPSPSWVLA